MKKETTLFISFFVALLMGCSGEGNNEPGHTKDNREIDEKNTGRSASEIKQGKLEDHNYYSFVAVPSSVRMYWKQKGEIIKTFDKLKEVVPHLQFAMNGGMFTETFGPVGLYVEKSKQLKGIRRYNNPKVNFGLQPQGVFLIRNDKAEVVAVNNYKAKGVVYATQSAPLLVIDSEINPKLPKSTSRTIRNGVGILPGGNVLMACSANAVTFREFAAYFKNKGCTDALFLDGGISGTTEGGGFGIFNSGYGVFVAVVK